MRVLALALVASVTGSAAGHLTINRSFEPWYDPGGGTKLPAYDIEYGVGYLWTSNGSYLVKRHSNSGAVEGYYQFGGTTPGAICSDGGYGPYFYFTELQRRTHIYRFEPYAGSVVGSFRCPAVETAAGIAFDGTSLYLADWADGCLYRTTTTGSVTATINLPFDYPWGIVYDKYAAGGPCMWCTTRWPNNSGDSYVYKLTTAGSVVDRAKWLFRGTGASGITIATSYLWIIQDGEPPAPDNLALQVKFISEPAVAPASVGRVKALFR